MARLDDQLEELRNCSSSPLRAQWRTVFRSVAPDMPPDLMRRAIAWRLQERVHGGFPPAIMKTIAALRATRHDQRHPQWHSAAAAHWPQAHPCQCYPARLAIPADHVRVRLNLPIPTPDSQKKDL